MILKDVMIKKRFLKASQLFWILIKFEDDKGEVQRCTIDLAKGLETEAAAELVEKLAQQIREI